MLDKKITTEIILTGEKSILMRTDRDFVFWKGKPFAQYSIIALKPLVSKFIIVSDHIQYDRLSYKCVKDSFPEDLTFFLLKESEAEPSLMWH